MHRRTSLVVFFVSGAVGALFFVLVFGTAVLDFTYTGWLMYGPDLPQHFTGWGMFRNSAWRFPPGLMDTIVYPFRESVVFTDSIPLFAFLFKLLSPVLPAEFQYFGLYGILVFFLQGAVAGLILNKLTGSFSYSAAGSVFFIFFPAMTQRIFLHTTLASHFIILLCIYVCLSGSAARSVKKDILVWGFLAALTVLIHLYFIPAVVFFLLFYLAAGVFEGRRKTECAAVFFAVVVILFVAMLLLGVFHSGAEPSEGGLGYFSANLNSLVNPAGSSNFLDRPVPSSAFLKDMPLATDGQYEGYSYLGLGMIMGCCAVLALLVKNHKKTSALFKDKTERWKPLLVMGAVFVFLAFALSPSVTLGRRTLFSYPAPGIGYVWSIFRSTGRMMWPAAYIIMAAVLRYIYKELKWKSAFPLVCILLLIQYGDLRNYFGAKGEMYRKRVEYNPPLSSYPWQAVAGGRSHLFFTGKTVRLYPILDFAVRNRLTVNDSYLARKNAALIERYKSEELERILNNRAREDTVYIFETLSEARKYAGYLSIIPADGVFLGIKADG
jgi:hypothetical protein